MESAPTRLLIAEDRASMGKPLVDHLRERGHEVRWVRSMRDLRAAMDEATPDILILDTTLEVDGLEFFQAIRFAPDNPRGGVVIMVEPGATSVRERAQQLGAAAVLDKPVAPEALDAVIADLNAFI